MSTAYRILKSVFVLLLCGSGAARAQTTYNYFAPGGALSCATAKCMAQVVNLAAGSSFLTNTLPVPQGGSGVGTLTLHGVLVGEGTGSVSTVAAMALDSLLQGQGATADPAAVALVNCGSTTSALAYSTTTHTFSCQTISGTAGLTATDIGYGGATNLLTGTTDLTYTHASQAIGLGSAGATASALNITGTSGFTLAGGTNTGSGNAGGSVTVAAGTNTTFTLPGGQLALTGGGPAFGGGSASLTGGASTVGNAGPGGTVTIAGGASPSVGGTGGPVVITTGLGASGSGTIDLQIGGVSVATVAAGAMTTKSALVSGGTTFTLGTGTGACATSSTLTGGKVAGSFVCTGTAGASTQIINLPTLVGGHGYHCSASDATSGVDWANQIGTTATGKISGTLTTTSDVVTFACFGY